MSLRKSFFTISLLSTCCLSSTWAMDLEDKPYATIKPPISAENTEDHETLYLSGVKAYKEKKYTDAFESFKIAAEQGNPKAQCYLGGLYRNKEGVPHEELPQADALAVFWYEKANEQNFARGAWLLALMYEYGKGISDTEKPNAKIVSDELKKRAFSLFKNTLPTDGRSQYNLGQMYQFYLGIPKNEIEGRYEKAAYWYTKAAENDDEFAQYSLSEMFAKGQGIEKNERNSFIWCKKAAENGNVKAQKSLGLMYAYGVGTEKDEQEARKWCTKAAENGDPDAQSLLKDHKLEELILDRDISLEKSTSKVSMPDDKENDEELYLAGIKFYKEKKYTDAFESFKKAAKQGDPKAQCYLGSLYKNKQGIPEKDLPQADTLAVYWYSQAEKQSFARGAWLLADMYEQEKGIPEVEKSTAKQKAKELEKKAFLLFKKFPPTDTRSQYNLGQMYQYRSGLPDDEFLKADEKAVYWYTKAAENEDDWAQFALSWMYLEGKGVQKNEFEAFEWCKKAAKQGHIGALSYLEENAVKVIKERMTVDHSLTPDEYKKLIECYEIDDQIRQRKLLEEKNRQELANMGFYQETEKHYDENFSKTMQERIARRKKELAEKKKASDTQLTQYAEEEKAAEEAANAMQERIEARTKEVGNEKAAFDEKIQKYIEEKRAAEDHVKAMRAKIELKKRDDSITRNEILEVLKELENEKQLTETDISKTCYFIKKIIKLIGVEKIITTERQNIIKGGILKILSDKELRLAEKLEQEKKYEQDYKQFEKYEKAAEEAENAMKARIEARKKELAEKKDNHEDQMKQWLEEEKAAEEAFNAMKARIEMRAIADEESQLTRIYASLASCRNCAPKKEKIEHYIQRFRGGYCVGEQYSHSTSRDIPSRNRAKLNSILSTVLEMKVNPSYNMKPDQVKTSVGCTFCDPLLNTAFLQLYKSTQSPDNIGEMSTRVYQKTFGQTQWH